MRRIALLLAFLLAPVGAWAQPACTSALSNSVACFSRAANLQLTDLLSGMQTTGPLRSPQSVGITAQQMLSLFNATPSTWSAAQTFSAAGTALTVNNNATIAGVTTLGSGSNGLTANPGSPFLFTAGGGGTAFNGGQLMGASIYAGRGLTQTLSGSTVDFTKVGLVANNGCQGTSTFTGTIPCVSNVSSGNMNLTANNAFVSLMNLTAAVGGASASSNQWGAETVALTLGTPTADISLGGVGAFVAFSSSFVATVSEGGASSPSIFSAFGTVWGTDQTVRLGASATGFATEAGYENDETNNADVVVKSGFSSNLTVNDTKRGAYLDAAYTIGVNQGSVYTGNRGWQTGFLAGGWFTGFFGDTDSTFLKISYSQDHLIHNTAAIFADGYEPNWGTDFVLSRNFAVDGSGNTCIYTSCISQISGGVAFSAANDIVTGITINARGTDYIGGDPLYYAASGAQLPGRTSVATVRIKGSPTIHSGGTGGTTGTNVTVTGTNGAFSVAATFVVDIAGGAITVVHSISNQGSYTQVPRGYAGVVPAGDQLTVAVTDGWTGQASFATNVMTLTSVTTAGTPVVGQLVTASGVAGGTTIASVLSGTGGVGSTYSLSTTPGTIAAENTTIGLTGAVLNVNDEINTITGTSTNEDTNTTDRSAIAPTGSLPCTTACTTTTWGRRSAAGATGATLGVTWTAENSLQFGASTDKLAFYAATPIVKATPSGACAGNTGCQALRDALGNLGLINTGSISN